MTKRMRGTALAEYTRDWAKWALAHESYVRDFVLGGTIILGAVLCGCSDSPPSTDSSQTSAQANAPKLESSTPNDSATNRGTPRPDKAPTPTSSTPVAKSTELQTEPPSPSIDPETEAAQLKEEAISAARKLSQAFPNQALAHILLGSAYYNTGQSDEAAKHLARGLEKRPDLIEAHEMLARIAYEKGEPEETVSLCQSALKLGLSTPELLIQMGKSLLDLGQTEDAIAALNKAVDRPNAPVEGHYLLAQAFMQDRDYPSAKTNFQQVINRVSDHTQAYFGLFTACQRLGQSEEAAQYREQFIKLEAIDRKSLTDRSGQENTLSGMSMVRETVAKTLFGAAQFYQEQGVSTETVRLYQRAASLDGENFGFRSVMEAYFVRSASIPTGVDVFQQLTVEHPGNVLDHFFLGRLQSRMKRFDAAERSFLKVQELMPNWATGYEALAELLLGTRKDPSRARQLASTAVKLEPSGARYYLLALSCLRTNDRTAALAAAKQATVLSPNQRNYAQLLQQIQGAATRRPANQ